MPQSKKDPKRKAKLNKFKQSKKQINMSEQIPEVRQVPVWNSRDNIEMNGLEFEALYNFINGVQGAYAAVQSIMNKNIISGNVKLNFEKLNETKTDYVPMTDEEQAPHKEEFEKVLSAAKQQAAQMVQRQDTHLEPVKDDQEGVPYIDALVDPTGNPLSKA